MKITGCNVDDARMLPELLDQIAADVEIGTVTVDGAYHSRKATMLLRNVAHTPSYRHAKNTKPWKLSSRGAIARNEALRASRIHGGSRAETKIHCVKLLGQRLMARDFDRRVAELHVRAAILDGNTALGIPVTEPVG
nr:transposase [Puniceibacterium confluentis]